MVWDGERWALDVQESEFMREWVGGGGVGSIMGGVGSIMWRVVWETVHKK